jgi:CubicO group peptidase (beta-lactamase class C family)
MPTRVRSAGLPLVLCALAAAQEAANLPPGLPEIAAAYAAKVAATARFVSGRTLDSVLAEELAPDAPLQALIRPWLSFDVDAEQRTVTARIGKASATAVFVEGLGCTLLGGARLAELRARALPPAAATADDRPWPSGDAQSEAPLPDGVDAVALDAALAFAFAEPEGRAKVRTRAVVVAQGPRLLGERYAPGYDARMPLPGWSMTKSVVDALAGIRVRDGALDPKAPLPVPEWRGGNDPRRSLQLDDLLRMQSGLQWTEDYEAPGSDVMRMLFASADCGGVAAAKPLEREPGTEHRYSSGTTNLLCRILRTTFASDAEYLRFPRDRLFRRIGMQSALIEPDASGTFVGSSFGVATARDWARFGLLYLRDGVWDGERLLPEGWVKASTTPGRLEPGYGRHFYCRGGEFQTLPDDLFYMSGHDGQYVFCFPSQDLVVVRLGCSKRGGFRLREFLEKVLAACGALRKR